MPSSRFFSAQPVQGFPFSPSSANLAAHQKSCWTNDLVFDPQLALMGIHLQGFYEPQNDITSDHYDDTPDRFKTLFGTRAITAK